MRCAAGVRSHVSHLRVLLIVMVDCQEIRVYWLHVFATGFCEHKLQGGKSLFVPLKCEHLSVVEIERTDLCVEKDVRSVGVQRGADLPFISQ